ncbi:hypothetical protein HK098_007550 [Nowakowskiella sp. JEL0407]|nr:hypothetical protein HK098_007550 [Nowakowskiella sp. JEL0407]
MGFLGKARWQREQIEDHKFDYVDVDDYTTKSIISRIRYSGPFIFALKSILVYVADLAILGLLFAQLFNSNRQDCSSSTQITLFCTNSQTGLFSANIVPIEARPWIILVSIMLSYILLFIDWRKATLIIHSRDISYAFTSTIANRYYCLRSYPHFCFFQAIKNQRKLVDRFAFFVFFAFKGWKRLILAEFPRQLLNGLSIFDVVLNFEFKARKAGAIYSTTLKITRYTGNIVIDTYASAFVTFLDQARKNNPLQFATYALQTFTVTMWCISFTILLVAFICYIPLLMQIRGNLKEYCVHKIDKRISELLKKKLEERSASRSDGTYISSGVSNAETAYTKYPPSDYGSEQGDYNDRHKSAMQPVNVPVYPANPQFQNQQFIPVSNVVMHGGIPLIPVNMPQNSYRTTSSYLSSDNTSSQGYFRDSGQRLLNEPNNSSQPYLVTSQNHQRTGSGNYRDLGQRLLPEVNNQPNPYYGSSQNLLGSGSYRDSGQISLQGSNNPMQPYLVTSQNHQRTGSGSFRDSGQSVLQGSNTSQPYISNSQNHQRNGSMNSPQLNYLRPMSPSGSSGGGYYQPVRNQQNYQSN